MSSHPPIESCYVSCGIQTDPVVCLCEIDKLNNLSRTQVVTQAPPFGLFRSDITGQAFSMTDNGSAYTQHHALIPTKRVEGLAMLGSSFSSASKFPSRRIVSFPVSSSPRLNQTSAKQTRVVSMPEIAKSRDKHYFHSSSPDGSSSTEPTEPSQNIAEEQLWECVCVKSYPSDLPRTPSPPSSPDSLVIVGDTHVCDPHFQSLHNDGDDWTAWASSPPRPIPALHGPLSLPYARCPSGAEGTVIEGQDLSHKIWGLGTDDVQRSSRSKKSSSIAQTDESLPFHSNSNSHHNPNPEKVELTRRHLQTLALPHNRDTIIDLSQPSTFHPNSQSQSMTPLCYGQTNAAVSLTSLRPNHSSSNTDPPSQPWGVGSDALNRGNICLTSADNYASSNPNSNVEFKQTSYETESPWKLGLGIPNVMTFRKAQTPGETENKLNKAAPVFIPANLGINTDNLCALIERPENSLSSQLDTQTRHSNGLDYTRKGEHYGNLLATPSTTSSQWSPVFSLTTPDLNAPRIFLTTSTGACNPSVYSPHADYEELFSNQLMNMQQDQNFLSIQRSKEFAKSCQQNEYSESSLRRKQHFPQQAITDSDDSTKQVLSGKRLNLSQQHPRSIPLARLIQRRLSSIPEELLNGDRRSTVLSHLPSTPKNASLESRLETNADHSVAQTIIEPTCTHMQTFPDETEGGAEPVMLNVVVRLPHSRTDKMLNNQFEGVISSTSHSVQRGKENMACNNAKPGIREGRKKTHKKTPITPKTTA